MKKAESKREGKPRLEIPKNKPILSMSKEESEQTWDDLGANLHKRMLKDARRNELKSIEIVVAMLVLPSGQQRVMTHDVDYGDEDTTDRMVDTIQSCYRSQLLKAGEKLDMYRLSFPLGAASSRKKLDVPEVTPRQKPVTKKRNDWGLYWCSTEDHDEDWFVIAKSESSACGFHEDAEGYDKGDATAVLVAVVPPSVKVEGLGWPENDQIRQCGGQFVRRTKDGYEQLRSRMGSGGRIVRFGDKVYAEGDIVRNCAAEVGLEPKN